MVFPNESKNFVPNKNLPFIFIIYSEVDYNLTANENNFQATIRYDYYYLLDYIHSKNLL